MPGLQWGSTELGTGRLGGYEEKAFGPDNFRKFVLD
jgi:hypothetical protein